MPQQEPQYEQIGNGIVAHVSKEHTFGTDSFLLSDFAAPQARETACDLCTGCGIIPLLWFRGPDAPKRAYAVDIQEQAADQLRDAVERSGLQDRLIPLHADLKELSGLLPAGKMDLVTCNPPYKAKGSGLTSGSHSGLIARHEVACTIDDVCASAARLLRFGGRLCLCQLPERLVDVLAAMRSHRIEPKRIRFVQKRPDTAPWLFLVEGKLGSRPFLKADAPLVLYGEDGGASAEMRRIYGMYGKTE